VLVLKRDGGEVWFWQALRWCYFSSALIGGILVSCDSYSTITIKAISNPLIVKQLFNVIQVVIDAVVGRSGVVVEVAVRMMQHLDQGLPLVLITSS